MTNSKKIPKDSLENFTGEDWLRDFKADLKSLGLSHLLRKTESPPTDEYQVKFVLNQKRKSLRK